MIRCVGMLLLIGSLSAIGCGQRISEPAPGEVTGEDVRRETEEAAGAAAAYSEQAKEKFVADLNRRLEEMDAEIAEFHAKGDELKEEAKVKWEQKLAELETKREAARAKRDEVARSTAAAWEDVKRGAEGAWKELDQAVRDAAAEY